MPDADRPDYPESVWNTVGTIVDAVRRLGDDALLDYSWQFDGKNLQPDDLRIPSSLCKDALDSIPKDLEKALVLSARRIRAFNSKIRPNDVCWSDSFASFGWRWTPIQKIGVYVPGGTASYLSSVLMAVIPAKVAGCEVILCTPPRPSDAVLAACILAGADSVFQVGGAQAVAAMAYGTRSIPKVDKIVGPGGAFVDCAKRLCSRDVAIDFPAGPTELYVVAGSDADFFQIAKDLVAQAEHDAQATVGFLALDQIIAKKVSEAVRKLATTAKRSGILRKSLSTFYVRVMTPDQSVSLLNARAFEHVALYGNAGKLSGKIKNAGAVYIDTPPALGDYVLGSNHVLPTGGFAKSAGMLSVYDFLKPVVTIRRKQTGLEDAARFIAKSEGLFAHADSLVEGGYRA